VAAHDLATATIAWTTQCSLPVLVTQGGGNRRSPRSVQTIVRILRTYARVYAANLDAVLPVLSRVCAQSVGTRFRMPNGLELATVGRVLVVAGDDEALAPFRATQATLIVDDLDECLASLSAAGARVVRGPQEVPTGRNLTALLAEGVQIEYVEWNRAQWEQDQRQKG
jgi:hypothetical protein